MKVKLFQVYDLNAEMVNGPIMAFEREGPAIREFHDALANDNTYLSKHPEDYELWLVGTQETHTGLISGETERITTGKQWKQAKDKMQSLSDDQLNRLRQAHDLAESNSR